MPNKKNLTKLFKPQSIAVVGATEKEGKVGNMIAKNIITGDYAGDVFFVNPKHDTLFDRICYASLADLPRKVDCTIIVIPSQYVAQTIEDGAVKCKNYVVISAGFGEIGLIGVRREMELMRIANENNVTILGPNCLGFLTPELGLNASFAPGQPQNGDVAFLSQSGALAVAFLDKAASEGIGFSSVVSIGNKMQLDASKLLDYFAHDPKTKIIALYLEGVHDGQEFLKAAQKISHKKPVIVLKSGRSVKAQKAIALHTGTLAGADDIMSAAFTKAGVLRADTMEMFFDMIRIAQACIGVRLTSEEKLAIITNAGGPGVLATDALDGTTIELATISSSVKDILRKKLPEAASVENPIDLLGDAATGRYEHVLKIIINDPAVTSILVILTPQDQIPVNEIAQTIVKHAKKTQKLIMTSFVGGARVKEALHIFREGNVIHTDFPERAISALALLRSVRVEQKYTVQKIDHDRAQKALQILTKAKMQKQKALYFSEMRTLANLYDLPLSRFWDVTDKKKVSHVSYPCVAKVDDPAVLHKTDKQGVILPISNMTDLTRAVDVLVQNFPTSRVIAQPFLSIKQELIIGMTRDTVYGPVVLAGIGGIYTEIFDIKEFFIAPLTLTEIRRILKNGSLGYLFRKTRGLAPYDLEAVVHTIRGLSQMAHENDMIQAIDINPLLVYNDNKKATIVDMKILL